MSTERLRLTLWMSVVFNFGVALIALMPQTAVFHTLSSPQILHISEPVADLPKLL